MDLFESAGTDDAGLPADSHAPLAVRMRPRTLDELEGQTHLLTPGSPLRRLVEPSRTTEQVDSGAPARPNAHRLGASLSSVVLWGPPGTAGGGAGVGSRGAVGAVRAGAAAPAG